MSDLEKLFGIIVSPINYKVSGMESTRSNRKILALNSSVKEAAYLETEIFKSYFKDLGKEEYFLEVGSYSNLMEEYEKTLKELLKKEHKVPNEYHNNLDEYRKVVYKKLFTNEEFVYNYHRYDEIHEVLGEYYVFRMRFHRITYNFYKIYYLKMKSFYDDGKPLYISKELNYKELGF
ncbi:hypothetical protein QE422_000569 [Chryseobacterium sp. SORGH_AS 447]|uniref:hypothetical protein n=1 Tax=Chryseobacterium sp. SORGH_AS_0447 TaxID=3041769 RepID=UPI00277FEAD5|nr:hypothetical protein [Chryseobacterium sp. SORGH_AS_0447]MDQ1160201.1 hypothetical protein [Chryseobacterium sp. SORGH_AS_0447]